MGIRPVLNWPIYEGENKTWSNSSLYTVFTYFTMLTMCFSGTSYNNPAVHYLDYFYPSFPGTQRNQQCWWRPPLLQGSPHYTTHWERPAGSQSPTGLECPHTAGRSEAYRRLNKHTNAPYLHRGKSYIHIH